MKKFVAVMMMCMAIVSCNTKADKGKFSLTGEIKNIPDQKIFLEQLYFSQKDPDVLDTAEIKNGKFVLSAIAQEEGLFRIRLEKPEHGFIFINDASRINFNADIKDVSLQGPIFNTRANSILKKLLITLDDKTKSLKECIASIDRFKTAGSNDSLASVETIRLNELEKDYKSYIVKFIDTASDPVVAIFAAGYSQNIDPVSLKEVIPNLVKRFPDHQGVSSLVLQYNQYIAQVSQPRAAPQGMPDVGSIAPDFTMNDVNNNPVSLSSFKGKYVLVDFWASWCGPCRGENPNVVAAYNKYKNKNFTILGVSLDDDRNAWLKAIRDDNLGWLQVSDLRGWSSAAVPLYGFDGIPYNVLIDPQGKIIATTLRGEALDKKLSELLQ